MDFQIIFISIISFVFFILVQIFYFRKVKSKEVFGALIYVYKQAATIPIILGIIFYFLGKTLEFTLMVTVISLIIYSLLVFIYTLCLFGLLESSIRIRLLSEVHLAGDKGITEKQIVGKYNQNIILKKRLARFLQSGEIKEKDCYYYPTKKISFYIIPFVLTILIWKLYGKKRRA